QQVGIGSSENRETSQSNTRGSKAAEAGENSTGMSTGGGPLGIAEMPVSDHDIPPSPEDEPEHHAHANYGTVDLFFQIFAEVDKDPNSKDEFLDRVEKLVSEGVRALDACRRLPRDQTNGFPRAKKNTVVLQNGKCQAGKGTETYIGFLKAWMQAGLVPIFQAKNDAGELGRHLKNMAKFNTFSARIWKLAGLDKREKPILDMFEDTERYETGLERVMDGGSVIPVYGLIDNPTRMDTFRNDVVPMIRKLGKTDDGALHMCFFGDEADLTIREKTTAGAKCWTDALDEWASLPAAFSSIVHVTATPAAIHLSEDQMGSKKHEFQEITASTFFWDYPHPSQKLPPNARVISREIGDLRCMVRNMLSAKRVQCALAIQSSVSHNADIDKQARRSAVEYAREGLTCLAWTANQLIVYSSDAGMRELFQSGRFFKKPTEVGDSEVSKIERQLRKEEEAAKDPQKNKNAQKEKKLKKGKESEKRIKRGKEADKSGEEPDEKHRGGKKLPRVFRYVPARVKDNDYSPFITYVHDKIEEVKKCEQEAAAAKKRKNGAGGEEDMVPKILTFSKVVAGRARSIKGSKHEWPLDHLFLDIPNMHFEGVMQAAGRAQSVDRRPPEQGPTMWGSEAMQLRLTNAIVADQSCREILRQGNTPLQVMKELLKDANRLPEGGELVAKSGVLEAVGPTGHSRKGTCLAYTGDHMEVTRTVKQKRLGVVLSPTGDAMEEEEEEKEEKEEGEGEHAGNEGMEAASLGADADGDPEPDAAYWVSNHLEDILGTMAQALRERKTSMTTLQMADDIPGREGYPTTNVPSLSIVQYIIKHHCDEMDAAGAYFLGNSFLP
ncbi:unnamed protein product, partial [Ectocarpus sp. 12 AP-2014]